MRWKSCAWVTCLNWSNPEASKRMLILALHDIKECIQGYAYTPSWPWEENWCRTVPIEKPSISHHCALYLQLLGNRQTSYHWLKDCHQKLKAQFTRHGIPNQIVSDNGPQFALTNFRCFSQKWDFEHYTISLHHSKANGMAKSAVKSAKRLFSKTKKAHSDPYHAVLELRHMLSQGIGKSPAKTLVRILGP